MIHDLSPFVFRFHENVGIRWYGLSYLVGFLVAYFLIRWISSRQKTGLTADVILDLVSYGAVGILLGGRLGYCLFYSPDLFIKFRSEMPFWGVFAVNEGGMSSHGGILGLVVACWIIARKYNVHTLYLFDLVSVASPIGIFFGRLANFVNGEFVGREVSAGFKWSVKFPQDILTWPVYEPGRLSSLSSVVEKVGVSSSQWITWVDQMRTDIQAQEKIDSTLSSVLDRIQSGQSEIKEIIGPLLVSRYPIQIFAAFGEGLLLFFILFFMWKSPRQSGFISACFLILYGAIRIFDEQFSRPDLHLGLEIFGATRGQMLSAVTIALGCVLMFIWGRSVSTRVQGWGRIHSIRLNRK